jgi:hypothetical protein
MKSHIAYKRLIDSIGRIGHASTSFEQNGYRALFNTWVSFFISDVFDTHIFGKRIIVYMHALEIETSTMDLWYLMLSFSEVSLAYILRSSLFFDSANGFAKRSKARRQ